jgi:hypothetical protein
MIRLTGVEPIRLAATAFETFVSTHSTISAFYPCNNSFTSIPYRLPAIFLCALFLVPFYHSFETNALHYVHFLLLHNGFAPSFHDPLSAPTAFPSTMLPLPPSVFSPSHYMHKALFACALFSIRTSYLPALLYFALLFSVPFSSTVLPNEHLLSVAAVCLSLFVSFPSFLLYRKRDRTCTYNSTIINRMLYS